MSRYKPNKERWEHPRINGLYVYDREGTAYVYVLGKRFSTGLKFIKENKNAAFIFLENKYNELTVSKTKHKRTMVSDVINLFIQIRFPIVDTYTCYKYKQSINSLIKQDFEVNDTLTIKKHILQNASKLSIKTNTLRKRLKNLRTIFQFGIDENLMQVNPVTLNMLPKEEKIDIVVPEHHEMKIILEQAYQTDNDLGRLIEFITLTGCRISECLKIHVSHIKDDVLTIDGKGGKVRYFPLKPFPRVKEILNESTHEMIFGFKIYKTYRLPLAKILNACNLNSKYTFHSFRRYCENNLINDSRFDINIVGQILGHSLGVQQKHYLEKLSGKKLNELLSVRLNSEE